MKKNLLLQNSGSLKNDPIVAPITTGGARIIFSVAWCFCNKQVSNIKSHYMPTSETLFNTLPPNIECTFLCHPVISLGKSNRKQRLNLCWGQRLQRLTCIIYATLGIKFSKQFFFGRLTEVTIIIWGYLFVWKLTV